jgi:ubiquinone/menaquinone biosynthesis C-methylase UbiE
MSAGDKSVWVVPRSHLPARPVQRGVRRFSAEYLETTRAGMWENREALADLALVRRERVLDVGAGSGELTRVLREETPGRTVALDVDDGLLSHVADPRVRGDATRLPFQRDAFDLVACQALLINLPEPVRAVREFTRVAADAVAAIEPDNSSVAVESTVDGEADLARRARALYLGSVETDPTLGPARDLFERAGIEAVTVRRYDHVRTIEPPYSERALEDARRKASGAGIESDRETILAGDTTPAEFDTLRQEWRATGREAIDQIRSGTYRHRETIPFYVTVGTPPSPD